MYIYEVLFSNAANLPCCIAAMSSGVYALPLSPLQWMAPLRAMLIAALQQSIGDALFPQINPSSVASGPLYV